MFCRISKPLPAVGTAPGHRGIVASAQGIEAAKLKLPTEWPVAIGCASTALTDGLRVRSRARPCVARLGRTWDVADQGIKLQGVTRCGWGSGGDVEASE